MPIDDLIFQLRFFREVDLPIGHSGVVTKMYAPEGNCCLREIDLAMQKLEDDNLFGGLRTCFYDKVVDTLYTSAHSLSGITKNTFTTVLRRMLSFKENGVCRLTIGQINKYATGKEVDDIYRGSTSTGITLALFGDINGLTIPVECLKPLAGVIDKILKKASDASIIRIPLLIKMRDNDFNLPFKCEIFEDGSIELGWFLENYSMKRSEDLFVGLQGSVVDDIIVDGKALTRFSIRFSNVDEFWDTFYILKEGGVREIF